MQATIRSTGHGKFYISFDNGTRSRNEYKTPAGAERCARSMGHDVTIDPGANPDLISVAGLCEYFSVPSGDALVVHINKYGADTQTIEFRVQHDQRPDGAVALANEFFPKMGFKPVRVTYNMLNPDSKPIVIDADTPSYCDVGSEAYHSM